MPVPGENRGTTEDRTAAQLVDARIKELRQRRREAIRTVRELALRLEEMESLRKSMAAPLASRSANHPTPKRIDPNPNPSLTDGVLDLLEHASKGMGIAEITESLEKKSLLDPQTPKSVLSAVLRWLVKQSRVTQSASGRYFIRQISSVATGTMPLTEDYTTVKSQLGWEEKKD
jgi:hypothetical protein